MSAELRPERPSESSALAQKSTAPTVGSVAARVGADLWEPLFRERVRVVVGLIAATFVLGAHLARIGTVPARAAAGVLLVVAVFGPAVLEAVVRRRVKDPASVLRSASKVLGQTEVERALAHASLAERIATSNDHEGVSPSLARLHASRALAKLDLARLAPFGERHAGRARTIALVLLAAAAIVLAIAPLRFVEGVDVAIARDGVAPLPIAWIDEPELTVHPPNYLHTTDRRYHDYVPLKADRGAVIVVRGTPRRTGRTLVLADDKKEVPFLDDGAGGVVARIDASISAHLRVRARFGNVVIEEPLGWDVTVIPDEPPRVELEGAPAEIEIAKTDGTIPLRYDAYDDHGLREIHLVIRVGTKEERRVLAKLDGDPKHDRGGYVLRTTDPLLQKARTPVRVRIEARDNDPITGPKWGKSAELTLIPPVIGAAEAARYESLRKQRDVFVDLLATAMADAKTPTTTAKLAKEFDGNAEDLEGFLSDSRGMKMPPRIGMIVRGRLRKVREALAAEQKSASATTRKATVEAIEAVVVRLDEALRALGHRDAITIAKVLVDVADDGADGVQALSQVQKLDDKDAAAKARKDEAKSRVDVDVRALDGGGSSMRRLGELGRDLGEIVENDLRRHGRALKDSDFWHGELALRDLAARLREPVPSFSSGGGGGGLGFGHGNPSSPGDPTGDPDEIGDESEGESQAGNVEQKVDELVKEHGGAIGEVEDHLRAAEDPKLLEGLEEEAKRRAERLRKSVAGLPKIAGLKKTLEASEAAAREKTEGMADSMEKLQLGDAKERGESALKAIEEARDSAWLVPGTDEQLQDIAKEVQKQLDWIDDILKKIHKDASEKAKPKLQGVAPREQGLGEKTEDLGKKSEQDSPLPGPIKDLLDQAAKKMKDAADALKKGEGDKAVDLQKEAQRLLEKARDGMRSEGEQQQSSGGENGKQLDPNDKVDIPKADEHKGPEDLRKRVLEGLGTGSTSPRLKDAVKRYADGLVK